tara:strand:+ start:722 stop:895 length:174 start_codon:yes stop_codon:yes gene_type:complete
MEIEIYGKHIEIEEIDRELILRNICHFGFSCYSWDNEGKLVDHTQNMFYEEGIEDEN